MVPIAVRVSPIDWPEIKAGLTTAYDKLGALTDISGLPLKVDYEIPAGTYEVEYAAAPDRDTFAELCSSLIPWSNDAI